MNLTTEEILQAWNAEYEQKFFPIIAFTYTVMVVGITANFHAICVYWIYYKKNNLRIYVLTLSVVDLLACVVAMPMVIVTIQHNYTIFNRFVCKFYQSSGTIFSIFSLSVLTVIAVDRLRRIIKPFGLQLSYRQSKIVCCFCGIYALVITVPNALIYDAHSHVDIVYPVNVSVQYIQCELISENIYHTIDRIHFYIVACCRILFICVWIVVYTTLSVSLWNKTKRLCSETDQRCGTNEALTHDKSFHNRKRQYIKGKRTSIVFLIVTLVSFLCFLPHIIFDGINTIDNEQFASIISSSGKWIYIFQCFKYINYSINPIVYLIVDEKFRTRCKLLYTEGFRKCFNGLKNSEPNSIDTTWSSDNNFTMTTCLTQGR